MHSSIRLGRNSLDTVRLYHKPTKRHTWRTESSAADTAQAEALIKALQSV